MKTATVEVYAVELTRPEGVSVGEMRDYIQNAVRSWCGQFDAMEDPRFYIGDCSVTVKRIPKCYSVHAAISGAQK